MRFLISLSITVALTGAAAGQPVQPCEDHPLARDRTGLEWTVPFKEAKARAEREERLLMIKAVAFGTTADGGW